MSGPPSSHQQLHGFAPVPLIRHQIQAATGYGQQQPQIYQPGGMAPMHPLANQHGLQPGGVAPIQPSGMMQFGIQPGGVAPMQPSGILQFGMQPGSTSVMYQQLANQSGQQVAPVYTETNQFGQQPGGAVPFFQQPVMYQQLANQSGQQVTPVYPETNQFGQQPGVALPIFQQPNGVMQPANVWNPGGVPHPHQSGQQLRGPVPISHQATRVAQPGNVWNQGRVWHEHVTLGPVDHRSQPSPSIIPAQGPMVQDAVLAPKRCVPPEASDTQTATTTVRIKMDEMLRESNIRFVFREAGALQTVESRDEYLYYEFPTLDAARSAYSKFNNPKDGFLFDIKVGVDRTCDTPTRKKVAAEVKQPDSSAVGSSSHDPKRKSEFAAQQVVQGSTKKHKVMLGSLLRSQEKQQLMIGPVLIGMYPGAFGWRTVKQFSAMKGNSFVELFKFDLAIIFGSVSSEVTMCWGTPIGKYVFVGILSYMCNAFRAGLSWGGCLTPEHMMVSHSMMCAIVPFPTFTASSENISLDVTSVVSGLISLYTLDGHVPPYFEHLVQLANNVPANISSDKKAREEYLLQLVNHMSCWPDERILSFLQAFHIIFKNLDDQEKISLNTDSAKTVAATKWKKPIKTDQLLTKVLVGSLAALVESVANAAQYLRHFGVHSNDHIYNAVKDLRDALLKPNLPDHQRQVDMQRLIVAHPQPVFTVKERAMVMAYYFKDFLAKFSSFLFISMEKKRWIKELCTPFIKTPYEMGAAPLGSLILEGANDAHWHTLFKVLDGASPKKLILYLKMVTRALWSVNKFRDELTNIMVLHKSSHLRDDDISCALCALGGICTSLSNSSKEQPNTAHLFNILAKVYSEKKGIIKGGRNYSAELLEMVYKCVHLSSIVHLDHVAEPDTWDCKRDACLAHHLFGLDSVEKFVCEKCGNDCEKRTSGKFVHSITANSLIVQKSKYPSDSLGALLKRDMLGSSGYCHSCKENNKMMPQGCSIICSPIIFSLVLEGSPQDTSSEIFDAISTCIDVSSVYIGLEKSTDHQLVSMICQEEQTEDHLVCFGFDTNKWIRHGEDNAEVGSWNDVRLLCKERTLRPVVLLFADADAN